MRTTVTKFWLQPTVSFTAPPQREEYDSDEDFDADCRVYEYEWRATYICGDTTCQNEDCPQHFE